jgi:translocation and assembly module TamA
MKRTIRLIGCVLGLFCTLVSRAEIRVLGVDGVLRQNVERHLQALVSERQEGEELDVSAMREAVQKALHALGYYDARFVVDGDDKQTRVQIDPGKPVVLQTHQVELTGQAKDDPAFQRLLRRIPKVGSTLHHGQYDAFKTSLRSLAMQKGYFDHEFKEHALVVSPDRREAYWRIRFDAGPRYRFGQTTFSNAQIDRELLDAMVPYAEGAPYDADDVNELVRRLNNSQWFQSVVVEPRFEEVQDHALPINVDVVPSKRHAVELGLGLSSDVGPRAGVKWDRPWVNSKGHRFGTALSVAGDEQLVDATYRIPIVGNPVNEYYELTGGLKNSRLNDTDSTSAVVAGARYWELENGWHPSVSLKWSYDSFTQGKVAHDTMVISPGVAVSRLRTRGRTETFWGDSQRYSLDVSDTHWGSDVAFVILQAQHTWLRTYAHKHRFVIRGHAGWIWCDDFDRLPPDLRFFAGGDQSVRGYDYKSIAPRDADGELIGASKLLTGTVEYNYRVKGPWWLAAFVDAGDAFDRREDFDLKVGFGIGIRWSSPIGQVKLDLARAVGSDSESGLKVYVGLGAQL